MQYWLKPGNIIVKGSDIKIFVFYGILSESTYCIQGAYKALSWTPNRNGLSCGWGRHDSECIAALNDVSATVEVWQAPTNGLYKQQDPKQIEFNLRGKFQTDEEGRYSFYCLRPTPYLVPEDGLYALASPTLISHSKVVSRSSVNRKCNQQDLQESFSNWWTVIPSDPPIFT